jgi:PilZ domain
MEHRCSIRIPSALDAIVNCRRVGVVHAKVKDVGLGGMFIETGSIALRLNMPVEVAVRVSENGAHRLVRLRALVVWTGPRGAGLMLRSFDDAIYGARVRGPGFDRLRQRAL